MCPSMNPNGFTRVKTIYSNAVQLVHCREPDSEVKVFNSRLRIWTYLSIWPLVAPYCRILVWKFGFISPLDNW